MLSEILKRIGQLKKRGFATPEEKSKLASDIATLKQEDQESVGDAAAEVRDLPETDPAGGDSDEPTDEEVEKGIKALFDRAKVEIKTELVSDLKLFMEEQRELSEKKAGVYHPELAGKRKEMSNRLRDITKALVAGDTAKLKEMTTDDSGSPYAGYTVDSELSAEVRHLITEYGVARREMFALQLTKGSYKAVDLATDITVYWVDEGAVILSTQAVLGREELVLKKLGAIVSMTNELLDDSEIDFVSFIASRVAENFAEAEDRAFFIGDGTSTYGGFTGLLNVSGTNEVVMAGTTFASIDADDLIDMIDETPSGALANAKFYMNRTVMSAIRKLKTSDGVYIYQSPTQGGPATVWGYPIVMVEAMPARADTADDTSFVLFGDLRRACIFGYKGSIEMARFQSGSVRNVANNADINLITTDRQAIRWTERVGYLPILPQAITKLTTAAASA